MTTTSNLPIEVELVVQLMPCQALRRSYDSALTPHPCNYFAEWGYYHTYDYDLAGPPAQPKINLPVVYSGKRQVVPEMLSGCRKAPIVCVGINPNLPGWTSQTRNAIHPYFDDVLQYAHYFRYRTQDKRRIPLDEYERILGTTQDQPASARPLVPGGNKIDTEPSPVLMYRQYQTLLDGLAQRKAWAGHKLSVGEDIAYANMVACPSTRWVVTPNSEDPNMPVMGNTRAKGIVGECFYGRRHFLRQLVQTLPSVIIVFSRTTAREFIAALQNRFSMGTPRPDESLVDLFRREIRLEYGALSDGTVLDARVIFMPHASANPAEFAELREPCIDHLAEEVDHGRLVYNVGTGHLRRGRGACVFCSNALYKIGDCDYLDELQPLASPGVRPLADLGKAPDALADKEEQLNLLGELAPFEVQGRVEIQSMAATPLAPPPMVLKGKIVSMASATIDNGAIYVREGRIDAVLPAAVAAPPGFEGAKVIMTQGVIYPGLLDLHNHLAYNILPPWKPPRRFNNRIQWQRRAEYRRDVSEPMSVLTRSDHGLIRAIVRYIETKLLLGGVTSGQGMRSRFGGNELYRGLIRNFEIPDDPALVPAGSRISDLKPSEIEEMRQILAGGRPYFFHLAEGLDTEARQQFLLLQNNLLLRPNLIGIHSLALTTDQHMAFADACCGVVWSPLSNTLLYGNTIDPHNLILSGVRFGLGSDWTPSGSRNILQEAKVAWLFSQNTGNVLGAEKLVRAVTVDASEVVGWNSQLGSLEPGKLADLLVLDEKMADPFDNLLLATERNVRLVVIGGQARYGERDVMEGLGLPSVALEPLIVGGRDKCLFLRQPDSPVGNLSFGAARDQLTDAMANLAELRNKPAPLFRPLNDEPAMAIELDMQADDMLPGPQPFADLPPLDSVKLDAATVIDDAGYFDSIESIEHLPAFLKGADGLRKFYRQE